MTWCQNTVKQARKCAKIGIPAISNTARSNMRSIFEIDHPLIKYSYMMTWCQNIVKQANRCAKIVNMMTVLPNNAKKEQNLKSNLDLHWFCWIHGFSSSPSSPHHLLRSRNFAISRNIIYITKRSLLAGNNGSQPKQLGGRRIKSCNFTVQVISYRDGLDTK